MLMDGTFWVCSTCILVFFPMVIDEQNVGVPVTTIIFTPKKDAKAGHALYDGQLLWDLVQQWVDGMGRNDAGETFELRVGMTDNDTREGFALSEIWPESTLLLCMFHVWQAWRNGLNCYLSCILKGDARQEIRTRFGRFLMQLLKEIADYPMVLIAYRPGGPILPVSQSPWQWSSESEEGKRWSRILLSLEGFWLLWSKAGIVEATRILSVPPHVIPRTTNHLESFNGQIKQKYFEVYQHSGHLPRFDIWVLLMVTQVLPDFFTEYDEC